VIELRRLPAPGEIVERVSVSDSARARIAATRASIRSIVEGSDAERLVVVVGPCSIHDRATALQYAERLREVATRTRDQLVIVMRTYFEKPRTTVGWKGFLHDPGLDGSCDLVAGLEQARALLAELSEMGLACGTEALDPVTPQYLGDLISWSAIGARTSESQSHRELASGLSTPVGFKNATCGDVEAALNALISARSPHTFFGVDRMGRVCLVRTRGNPVLHIVLRGGERGPNFDAESVARAAARMRALGVPRGVMVDCSHGNSRKDHARQSFVCREVIEQVRSGQDAIMGLMLESHLEAGSQSWRPGARLEPGVSITDACIGWDETEKLLYEAAEAVAYTRAQEVPA
jgi:3-deoxy-7-phosphoheptulonate synthase